MSWFNKKKKEDELDMSRLPELPDISEFNLQSQLPEVPPGLSNELPSLPPIQPPTLPPIQPPFSTAIKPFQNNPIPETRISSQKFSPTNYPIEGLGMREIGGIKPITREIQEPQFETPASREIEPIYIRLDKFETTINSINEMQNKIREIESLLSRTKEIKMKEEKEIEEWEKEIQGMKSRMDFIDKNVFNKLG